MDLHLKDKVAIISGGTKGIGAGIAEVLAEEGCKLILDYRSDKHIVGEDFVNEIKEKYGVECYGIRADVSDPKEVVRIFDFAEEKFGHVDILINNAGGAGSNLLCDITLEEWNYYLDNNITQYFTMCKEFISRALAKGNKGWICNVLSKASLTTTTKGRACYVTNKTAQMGLTKQITVDYADQGITCNGIMPGSVVSYLGGSLPSKEMQEARAQRSPIKRMGQPYEFGKMVAFLVSDQNGLSHGAPVDNTGGRMLGF